MVRRTRTRGRAVRCTHACMHARERTRAACRSPARCGGGMGCNRTMPPTPTPPSKPVCPSARLPVYPSTRLAHGNCSCPVRARAFSSAVNVPARQARPVFRGALTPGEDVGGAEPREDNQPEDVRVDSVGVGVEVTWVLAHVFVNYVPKQASGQEHRNPLCAKEGVRVGCMVGRGRVSGVRRCGGATAAAALCLIFTTMTIGVRWNQGRRAAGTRAAVQGRLPPLPWTYPHGDQGSRNVVLLEVEHGCHGSGCCRQGLAPSCKRNATALAADRLLCPWCDPAVVAAAGSLFPGGEARIGALQGDRVVVGETETVGPRPING